MSSRPADRDGPAGSSPLLFWGWSGFSLLCVASMVTTPSTGAVAFHLVWISLAVVYGWQNWSNSRTAIVLALVVALTALGMASFIDAEDAEWSELAEVPLMAVVFLVMVWHVRRRAAALAESRASAAREQRATELKEVFVRQCSHEMRTPITVARGYAELARSQTPESADAGELAVVIDELDKLADLAGRLLMLADVYDNPHIEQDCVDLADVVRRGAIRWSPTADRQWSLESPSVLIEGDESRLESALDCLVENAVKFTNDGERIALRCGTDDGWAYLEVEDTGIGFDQSSAANRPRTAGRAGTGLGLPIVRAVAESHGGRLTRRPGPKTGACLRLEMPLLPTETPPHLRSRSIRSTAPVGLGRPRRSPE